METPLRITTACVEPRERLRHWNEAAVGAFGPLVVDAVNEDGFAGELVYLPLKSIGLCSAQSSAAIVRQSPARQWRASGDDTLNILLQDEGRASVSIGGRQEYLEPGDFLVVDPTRSYTVAFEQPVRSIIIQLPRPQLAEYAPLLEAMVGVKVSGSHGGPHILSNLARTLTRELALDWDTHIAETADRALWSLLELAYPKASSKNSRADYWLCQAKAVVRDGLAEPDLNASSIALALGLSERYVQNIFSINGMTPGQYVLAERLKRAAARLGAGGVNVLVTDVALDVGFNDLSYFSRAFKRRYRMTPREWQVHGKLH